MFLVIGFCVLFVLVSGTTRKPQSQPKETYMDGIYEGRSRSKYIHEPFMGHVVLQISQGKIKDIRFSITDTLNHEVFNEKYEKHYAGNNEYIIQCRNDWRGTNLYPAMLLKKQDIRKIDAISGATWSYNIFTACVNIALSKAQKK